MPRILQVSFVYLKSWDFIHSTRAVWRWGGNPSLLQMEKELGFLSLLSSRVEKFCGIRWGKCSLWNRERQYGEGSALQREAQPDSAFHLGLVPAWPVASEHAGTSLCLTWILSKHYLECGGSRKQSPEDEWESAIQLGLWVISSLP